MILNLDTRRIVENSFSLCLDWKPMCGEAWYLNPQGRFEKKFNEHVKQVLSWGYKGVEVKTPDIFVSFLQHFVSQSHKYPTYQIEVKDKSAKKIIYLQKQHDTFHDEIGNKTEGMSMIKKALSLIQTPVKSPIIKAKKLQRD